MQFKLLAALALAPLALAFGAGYEDNHALIARDLSGLKAQISTLERRLAEASYDDEDLFDLSARSVYDEDDLFDLSARSPDDDFFFFDMGSSEIYTLNFVGSVRTHAHNQVTPQNINQINTKLGQFRKGSESRTTADKHAEIERKQRNRENRRG